MTIHSVPDAPAVQEHRDHESRVTYLDVAGVQLAVEDVPGGLIDLTVSLPVELLATVRALLNHPHIAALLDAHEATARPPVA